MYEDGSDVVYTGYDYSRSIHYLNMKIAVAFVFTLLLITSCGNNKNTGFTGADMDDTVEILRDKDTKAASLEVKKNIPWKLYSMVSADSAGTMREILDGKNKGVFPLDIPANERRYFFIKTPKGNAVISERVLPMSGTFNFRDLGGYKTGNGKYVKWGKLFRSGEMSGLTGEDRAYLESIPLISVVDFRASSEISSAPDVYPSSVQNVYSYPITRGIIMAEVNKMPDKEEAYRIMVDANTAFVTNPEIITQLKYFFETLQDKENTPLVFHCTAGKDRTGIASALILLALGVDEETVIKDYILSNRCIKDKYAAMVERYPNLEPLLQVDDSYIRAAFDKIKENHGSFERFFTEVLEIDPGTLKELYLY